MANRYHNYDITLVVTHRCNARCVMCNSYDNPTCAEDELTVDDIRKIPATKFLQITGGEPCMRNDLEDIVSVLSKKTKRLMIITNGFFTEKIVDLCSKYRDLAVRVSIDGDKETHNAIRRIDIYERSVETLNALKDLRISDLGISFTLQEDNADQLIKMYEFAVSKGVDFGVSVVHNSYYFSKDNNTVNNKDRLKDELRKLVRIQVRSGRSKDWARAFFNDKSIDYIDGKPMPVKCDAGLNSFTIESNGNVLPCNMTPEPWIMGNIKSQTWNEVLESKTAGDVNIMCRNCTLNCWSICNVQSALKKHLWIPCMWLIKNKISI